MYHYNAKMWLRTSWVMFIIGFCLHKDTQRFCQIGKYYGNCLDAASHADGELTSEKVMTGKKCYSK